MSDAWAELRELAERALPRFDATRYGRCQFCLCGPTFVAALSGVVWCSCQPCTARWRSENPLDEWLDSYPEEFEYAVLVLAECSQQVSATASVPPPFFSKGVSSMTITKTKPQPCWARALPGFHELAISKADDRALAVLTDAAVAEIGGRQSISWREMDPLVLRVWEKTRRVPIGERSSVEREIGDNPLQAIRALVLKLVEGGNLAETLEAQRNAIDEQLRALRRPVA